MTLLSSYLGRSTFPRSETSSPKAYLVYHSRVAAIGHSDVKKILFKLYETAVSGCNRREVSASWSSIVRWRTERWNRPICWKTENRKTRRPDMRRGQPATLESSF